MRSESLNDLNPYRAPSTEGLELLSEQRLVSDSRTRKIGRVLIGVFALLAHVYFWALLLSWTGRWISGQSDYSKYPGLVLYACEIVCVVTSGIALHAIIYRRVIRTTLAILACVLSFALFVLVIAST